MPGRRDGGRNGETVDPEGILSEAAPRTLIIACGAIARELLRIRKLNGWSHFELQCLPAELHNRPKEIPAAVLASIEKHRARYERIFVGYADCGTGGALDRALATSGVNRLPGAHCYEFFAGGATFGEMAIDEPGSFFLTDFLVRHFERLVVHGLGLDRHPQLLPTYFGNYRRLVYIAQTDQPDLQQLARRHAAFLGLEYHYRLCGDAPLALTLQQCLTPV